MSEATAPFHSEIERQLADALAERDIAFVFEFRIPGTHYVFDFILPEPPFGVIEVKGPSFLSDPSPRYVERLEKMAHSARRHFGGSVRLYLVVLGDIDRGPLKDVPPGVILCQGDIAAIADTIAADFRSHSIRLPGKRMSPTLADSLGKDTDELSRTLSQLVLNLDCLFLNENREVLENEIVHLRDEIRHHHFTAAALRVGRSVEFIIYAACKSWGVPVREPVLVGLKKLDARFHDLKSALLEYSGAEGVLEQRQRARQKFLKKTNELQKTLNEILFEIDDNAAADPDDKKGPINTNALLADIRKQYGQLEEVRNAIDSQKEPLNALLRLRNDAAHASLDGDAREVERQELQTMIGFLNEVLMALSKCGTAIESSRDNRRSQ